jgi:CelD/BcsL family acetyltransferase involved in cellulose biosynthesis
MTSSRREIDVLSQSDGTWKKRELVPSADSTAALRPQTAQGAYDIEIGRELAAVEADWRELETDGALTPFQSLAWLAPLYRVLTPRMSATPLFVLLRDKRTRRPLLLLPLCLRRRYGFNFLEFADFGVCDYNAPILAKDFDPSPNEWNALWDRVLIRLKDAASVMRLQKLPQRVGGRANPLSHDNFAAAMSVGAWGVELPETTDRYDNEILTPTFRKELAKKLRRVAKRGKIEWVTATTGEERVAAFNALLRQRQARCDEMGRHNVLSESAFRDFYDALTSDPSTASLVRLNALNVGGESVASMLSLRHGDATYVIMTTFEGGDWKSASLGNVLIREAVERNIGDGVRYFDLTIGDEAYKRDFGARRMPLYSIVRPLSLAGVALAAGVKAATKLRDRRVS